MHLNKLEFWSLWAFLNILVIFHIFSLSLETDISKCCVLRSLDSHYNHTLLQLTSKRKILGNLDNFTHPFLNFTDLVLTVLTCPLLFCWIQKLTLLLRKESSLPKLLWLGLPVSLAPSRAPRRAYPFQLFLTTVNGSRYDPHPPQVKQIGKCLEKK